MGESKRVGKQLAQLWLLGLVAVVSTTCSTSEPANEQLPVIAQSQQALEVETVSLKVPTQGTFATTFMSTTNQLSIFSQAVAGVSGTTPWLTNFGPGQTHLQSQARVNGNIRSVGSVKLDSQSYVAGSIWTKGSIIKQLPVTITGSQNQGPSVNVSANTTSWGITWGDFHGPDVVIGPAPTETWVTHPPLAPGRDVQRLQSQPRVPVHGRVRV